MAEPPAPRVRARRRCLPVGRRRAAGARRLERSLLRADRAWPCRSRRGGRQADGDARVHDELGGREPAFDRGRSTHRRPRARRSRARVLRQLRLRGSRVRGKARSQLSRRPGRRRPVQGHLPRVGVPRHDPGRALHHRGAAPARALPPDALGRRAKRAQHVARGLGARARDRGQDPRGGAGDRRDGDRGAGAERARRTRAARRLLARASTHLRQVRRAACAPTR